MKRDIGKKTVQFMELYRCGIYIIRNKRNGRCYIGQSSFIFYRWYTHIGDLIKGRHPNKKLQEDFIKFGLSAFEVQILEECKEEKLLLLENYYMKTLYGTIDLYNILNRNNDILEVEEPEYPY